MGRMHYRCWKALAGAAVAAVCDADPHAWDASAKSRGNIAGAEGELDLTGVKVYGDFDEMIRQETLDAVSITLPTHLHAKFTAAALEAGVHVLCEKPIALDLAEGRRMIDAAERCGKLLQIGHCIRFWPEYAKAKQIVNRGEYGRVLAATFQRLSATAARKANGWYTQNTLSGGMPLDLHIHDTDFVQHLFGMPQSVSSFAVPADAPAHMTTSYGYDDGKLVTAEGGWAMMPSFGFSMRFHMVMEKATLDFDYQRDPKLRLCPAEGAAIVPSCEPGDGYSCEIAHFARRIRGEPVADVITPEQAWNSLRIVEAERESARTGTKVSLAPASPKGQGGTR
jgi:predicted dehydrogenase